MTIVTIAMVCGLIAVLYGVFTSQQVLKSSPGNEKMQSIAAAIQEGAQAYLGRQYTAIAIVGVVLLVVIGFALSWLTAAGFAIGAVLSGLTGYIGMKAATKAKRAEGRALRAELRQR